MPVPLFFVIGGFTGVAARLHRLLRTVVRSAHTEARVTEPTRMPVFAVR
ncbi:MAG: hypothetical protein ACK5IN_06980 [Microbacterium sp.]